MRQHTKNIIRKLYGEEALTRALEEEHKREIEDREEQEIIDREMKATGNYDEKESII